MAKRTILERIRKPQAQIKRYLVVIYARGGVGKTTLLGTIPGQGLVIDVPQYEGGDMVLADKRNRIDIAPVETWEELNDIYLALKKNAGKIGDTQYNWVAIDTITACQQLARKKVIKERDEITSKPYQIRGQDWGSMKELMGQLFERFRLLSMPVYFTAQEKVRRDRDSPEEDAESIVVPNVQPAAIDLLLPHPMLIGRLYMHQNDEGKWERYLRVGPHENFVTKARSMPGRRLPPIIRKPNLGQIIAWMCGEDVKRPRAAPDDMLSVDLSEAES
jgi:phage nucleotide-binding protein